jgi:hypothetical protein
MKQTSLLPKLLAKENVTIQHGNFNTAWFDIKNRVLGLPLWEDMHKDVYDLFVGHEVGHALETPFEGWHDSPEKLKGCPRSYINVVEDARIERKIQARYPGLVGSFNRGYNQLLDREFFGDLTNIDWDQVKLIDKINLKTKLGTKLDVPFSDEERTFLVRSLNTSTFDEVLDLVRDILAWTRENQDELMQKPEPQTSEDQNNEDQNSEENDTPGHDDAEDPSEDTEEASGDGGESEDTDSEEKTEEVKVNAVEPEHTQEELDISITDTIFREKEKTLTMGDDKVQPVFIGDVNKDAIDKVVINYAKLKEARELHATKYASDSSYGSYYDEDEKPDFKTYLKSVKKNVQVAVKEFEMRKAAYQYTRATTAKTGTINVNKLWSYKTNEDIFLTATNLANAKNHGMMLLIDMSGSMSGSMNQVMDQVMHLVMFCKATNIPFDVYGFTSTNRDVDYDWQKQNPGVVDLDNLSMPNICSSSFNKKDFIDSMEHMHKRATTRSSWGELCSYEEWGSTPLNQALMVSHHLVKKFKARHGIEKMNFITFTDGDANNISTYTRSDAEIWPDRHNAVIQVDGTMIKTKTGSRVVTKSLLDNISKKYNTNNIGFFMADDNQHWRQRLWILANSLNKHSEEYKRDANKEYRQNKCVTVDNVLGYNEYYLVKGGKNLETQEDEFSVKDDASNANIRTAFKKFAKSKKQNKVLMTKFGKAVA